MNDALWANCFSNNDGDGGGSSGCYNLDGISVEEGCGDCFIGCLPEGVAMEDFSPDLECTYNPGWEGNTCVGYDVDYDEDGQIDNPSCNGDYSNYVNNSQDCSNDNNNCQNELSACMGTQNYSDNCNSSASIIGTTTKSLII